jgi:hypothetical protein
MEHAVKSMGAFGEKTLLPRSTDGGITIAAKTHA